MSPAHYRQEWLCDFSSSSDDVLITIDLIAGAYFSPAAPKVLGVDVARFGDDCSVIIKRQGCTAFEPMIFQSIDNMQLASKVGPIIADWQPDGVFTDAGRGEGVIDRLRQLGHSVSEVNFGGRPSTPISQCARSRCARQLVDIRRALPT